MGSQKRIILAKYSGLVLVALMLTACSSGSHSDSLVDSVTSKPLTAGPNGNGVTGTADAAFTAALSPLEDLGIRKRKIPPTLKQIAENPYAMPATLECDSLKQEMAQIDTLLGPDVDQPKMALTAAEEYAQTGGEMAQDAVVGFVRAQTNVIPLRSIVRRITGANKNEKEVNNAIQAGNLRRAYLRGLAEAKFGSSCLATRRIISTQADTPKADEEAKADTPKVEDAKGEEVADVK